MTLLKVRNLKVHFFMRRGTLKAVDDVSFDLEKGKTLGIVGESGSGKSTVSTALLRLVPSPGAIVGGTIVFDGVDLLSLSEKEMERYRGGQIAMILQDPMSSLNPVLTVGDQVGEGVALNHRSKTGSLRSRVIELLRQVGIPAPESRVKSYPHQFSGGMRQRVVGAIALGCGPQLLIADEPTTSLDVTIQKQYLDLLKKIQEREGLAMIFITHDFGIVAQMCDQVAVMYAGRIVEEADVRSIFNSPAHPYTKALIASVPSATKKVTRLSSIEGQPPSMLNLPEGCAFQDRCAERFAACSRTPPAIRLPGNRTVRCWRYADSPPVAEAAEETLPG